MTTLRRRGFQAAGRAPGSSVRGYWRTVGYRLRYDYVTLFFALVIVLSRSRRSARPCSRPSIP